MIVVTKIETIECEDRDFFMYRDMSSHEAAQYGGEIAAKIAYELEPIRGMKFAKLNGDVVVVGMSKQAQEAIGLPLEAFDTLQRELNDTIKAKWEMEKELATARTLYHGKNEQLVGYQDELVILKEATLWQRIKWVFTGVTVK